MSQEKNKNYISENVSMMRDLRRELLTYSKDQLIELQSLLRGKKKRIEAEMYMMFSPDNDKYVTYRYTTVKSELEIVSEILKLKEQQ